MTPVFVAGIAIDIDDGNALEEIGMLRSDVAEAPAVGAVESDDEIVTIGAVIDGNIGRRPCSRFRKRGDRKNAVTSFVLKFAKGDVAHVDRNDGRPHRADDTANFVELRKKSGDGI